MTSPVGSITLVGRGDVHETVIGLLASDGQRYTASRRRLVEVLARSEHPLTLPEILVAAGDVAQSSAYRNLAVLERAGVVSRVLTADEFGRYELTEDLTGHHHHHLVCTECGTVLDVVVPDELEHVIDEALARLAGRHGFEVSEHRLDLIGRCSSCR